MFIRSDDVIDSKVTAIVEVVVGIMLVLGYCTLLTALHKSP